MKRGDALMPAAATPNALVAPRETRPGAGLEVVETPEAPAIPRGKVTARAAAEAICGSDGHAHEQSR